MSNALCMSTRYTPRFLFTYIVGMYFHGRDITGLTRRHISDPSLFYISKTSAFLVLQVGF